MAARAKSRQYPTAYKLKAIKRAEGGEGVLPVARKLAIVGGVDKARSSVAGG